MEKGRNNMSAPVIFFLSAFVLSIIGALMLMRATDNDAKKAVSIANAAQTSTSKFEARFSALQAVDQDTITALTEQKNRLDKVLQELEWVKMKASIPTTKIVQAPVAGPIKVEPIQVQVVYRTQSKSKPLLPHTISDHRVKGAPDTSRTDAEISKQVIKSVKQKLKERTQ